MSLKLASCLLLVMLLCTCRQKTVTVPQFTDVSQSSGIQFSNTITETEEQNIFTYEYMYNGAGVAVGDVNGDGLEDVYFTANQLPNQLYLNKGNLQFEDITATAQVAGKDGWKTGVTMADVNADGLLDIYVCYSGKGDTTSRRNQLFINKGVQNGKPVFADEAAQYDLQATGTNSTQALFFDYDRDGDLDMFLLNHATMFYSPLVNTYKLRHKRHPWYSNYLFRNDGGHFTDISATAGIAGGGNNFGLGVVASDINNDGWPDLYMTNDYEEQDFLLLNNRNGGFSEVTKQCLSHISKYGMGCDVADYNNDGRMDIMVPDMWPEDNYRQKLLRGPDEYDRYHLLVDSGYMHQNMRNTLQFNSGQGKNGLPQFSEIGQLAGVSATDWSWSSLLADLDNDGYKDLFVSNGFWRDYSNMDFQMYTVNAYQEQNGPNAPLTKLIEQMPQTRLSNYAFRNKGDLSFENVTDNWGLHTSNVSHGAAYADLDNDGDLDLVVNNMGENASVYRNNASGTLFLTLKLKGQAGNTAAIGSRVEVTTATGKQQTAEQQPVRGYLSCMPSLLHFGLGKDSLIATLTIRWPRGGYTILKNVKANQTLTVDEATAKKDSLPSEPQPMGILEDVTATTGIDFRQKENAFVDFKQEYLLPWQLSRQGPKMSKADVNGDGLEDVFIGAPKGQAARLYLQQASGNFKLSGPQGWTADSLFEDIESAFFDADADGDADLYVVSGGNENRGNPTLLQDRLYLNNGKGFFTKSPTALPVMTASKACVTIADYDGDGKPDIFVGGRMIPGQYGLAPQSYLLHNATADGVVRFMDATATAAPALQKAGMITSATWTDLNNDRRPDLLIAGEWMPVKVFINQQGKLVEQTTNADLANNSGLWTKIIPMDVDHDRDIDFMLGNLAPNTQFKASIQQPLTLCVNDFLKVGNVVPVVCQFIQGQNYPYASRNELVEAMPPLAKKFLYYKDYAVAKLSDIFTPEQQQGMQEKQVTQLKNCWLENKGNGKLQLHELPVAAQFSTLQNAVEVDTNSNGKPAIFAAGNFYSFRVQLGREDAGKGILLQWDARSKQLVVSPQALGIMADGDVRDIISLKTAAGKQVIVLSKTDDAMQVLQVVKPTTTRN